MKSSLAGTLLRSMLPFMLLWAANMASAATPTESCSLLTTAKISEVLGVRVQNGERIVASSPTICGWTGPGGPANSKRVVASILTLDIFSHEKTPLKGIIETQAPGLGDDAHYMTTPGFGTGLSVKKGNFAFKIRVYGFPDGATKEKEKILAQQVLAQL